MQYIFYASVDKNRKGEVFFPFIDKDKRLLEITNPDLPVAQLVFDEIDFISGLVDDYYGWEEKNGISMVWQGWGCFDMCFHYGSKAEEERGNGRRVRLKLVDVLDVST